MAIVFLISLYPPPKKDRMKRKLTEKHTLQIEREITPRKVMLSIHPNVHFKAPVDPVEKSVLLVSV